MTTDARPRLLIVDLDGTVCSDFWTPVPAAVDLLRRLDPAEPAVASVTARPEVVREYTAEFMAAHRLPDADRLFLRTRPKGSQEHKAEVHARLAADYHVLASVDDQDEVEGRPPASPGYCSCWSTWPTWPTWPAGWPRPGCWPP